MCNFEIIKKYNMWQFSLILLTCLYLPTFLIKMIKVKARNKLNILHNLYTKYLLTV